MNHLRDTTSFSSTAAPDPARARPARKPRPNTRGRSIVLWSPALLAAVAATTAALSHAAQPDALPQAGVRVAAPGRAILIRPAATRLVVPVRIGTTTPPVCPPVRGPGGTPLPAELVCLGIDFDHRPSEALAPAHWMGRPGLWVARSLTDSRAPDVAAWVVAIDISAAPLLQAIEIGSERLAIQSAPPEVALGTGVLNDAATHVLRPLAGNTAAATVLVSMLEPMLDSPPQRWRAEPLLRALEGETAVRARLAGQPGSVRTRRPGDRVAEALAEQTALRWFVALGTLSATAPARAHAVASRLMALAPAQPQREADGPLFVPFWPTEEDEVAELLESLLDDRAGPDERAAKAGAWLRSCPAVPTLISPPPTDAGTLSVVPPGLNTGPFHAEWIMTAWTRAQSRPSDDRASGDALWATAAFITKDSRADEWCLWVEARTDPDAPGKPDADIVRVWFTQTTATEPDLTILSGGTLLRPHAQPEALRIARSPHRWLARLPIPAGTLDAQGRLALALTRTNPRGSRSSWPGPAFPWQAQPQPATLDTAAWPSPSPK